MSTAPLTPAHGPLSVALIGCSGYPGQDHLTSMYLPSLRRREDVRLLGVVACSPEETERAAAAGLEVLGWDEAVTRADAAVVTAAIDERPDVIGRVIRAGVPLLCDKPAAAHAADIEQLVALSERHQVPVTVAHHFRYHTMFAPTAASIARGAVGLPFALQADLLVAGGDSQGEHDLTNLGVHAVDLMRTLLVGSEARTVRALGTDHGCVLHIDHDNGVRSTLMLARTEPLAGVVPASTVVHRYRVSGSHGTETIDLTKPGVRSLTSTGEYQRWIDGSSVDRLLADWIAAVRAGRTGAVTLRDAVRTARILDAAEASLAAGGAPVPCVSSTGAIPLAPATPE